MFCKTPFPLMKNGEDETAFPPPQKGTRISHGPIRGTQPGLLLFSWGRFYAPCD